MFASLAHPKPLRQAFAKPEVFSIVFMGNRRRERFLAYFETRLKGSRQALMTKTGLTKGRLSQLFDPAQPFGEAAARNLALRLGLDADYFETDHQESGAMVLTPEERELILAWRRGRQPAAKLDADVEEAVKKLDALRAAAPPAPTISRVPAGAAHPKKSRKGDKKTGND